MALLAAEQHTDELEAWLFDEGKVVTARWLSLVLNLPASQARRILGAFYRTHRGKVHATFLVSGQRADSGAREVVLLSEDTVAMQLVVVDLHHGMDDDVRMVEDIPPEMVLVNVLSFSSIKDDMYGSVREKDRIFSKVHSLQVYGLHVSQKLGQGDFQLLAGDMALARELADAKSDSGESFRLNKLSAVSCSHITISEKPYQVPLPPPPKPEHTSSSSSSTSRATEGPSGALKNNKSKDNFATFFNRRPSTAKDAPEEKAKAKPEEPKDNKDTPNKRSKPEEGGAKRKGSGEDGDADVKAATKTKASLTTEKEEEEGEEDKEGSPPKRARHDSAPEQDEDDEQADKKPDVGENGDDNDVSSSEDEWEPEHKSAEDKKVDKAAKKKAKAKAQAEKKRSNSEDGGEGDDVDEEGTKKKTRREKKSKGSPEDEDAVQIVQEPVSGAMDAFVSSSTAPTEGPRTTKKLVEKSYVDDRGYLVIENVWEEVEVAAPPPAPAPAPPPPKPSQPSQPASKKSKKDTAKDKQNDGRVQKSMLSFFKRK